MLKRINIATFAFAVALMVACDRPVGIAPMLSRVSSVVVVESDSDFVAYPSQMAASTSGLMAVSDIQRGVVMLYGRDGKPVRQIGHRGDGPGELRAPSWLAFTDSSVLVANLPRLRIVEFGLEDGKMLREIPVPMRTGLMLTRGGAFIASVLPDSLGRNLLRWPVLASGEPGRTGWSPALFVRAPQLAEVFGTTAFLPEDSATYFAFEVSNQLYRVGHDGAQVDSMTLTPMHRNGSDEKAFSRAATDVSVAQRLLYSNSIPVAITRNSDSTISVVYADVERRGSRFATKYWVTTLDWGNRKQCEEARLPVHDDPRAVVALVPDTLVAFEQIVSDSGMASTMLSRFALGGRCATSR